MIIYLITNKVNGKVYIGQTINTLSKRWSCHKFNSKTGNTYLYRAIRQDGLHNFSIEVLSDEASTKYQLNQQEQFYISLFHSNNSDYGYNLTGGGQGSSNPTRD